MENEEEMRGKVGNSYSFHSSTLPLQLYSFLAFRADLLWPLHTKCVAYICALCWRNGKKWEKKENSLRGRAIKMKIKSAANTAQTRFQFLYNNTKVQQQQL